jgi:hypothetical protein
MIRLLLGAARRFAMTRFLLDYRLIIRQLDPEIQDKARPDCPMW